MNDMEKLRVILPHWIDHNVGHGKEFANWAEKLETSGEEEIAVLLKKAESFLLEADSVLQEMLKKIGGPLEGEIHHSHHHNDHD